MYHNTEQFRAAIDELRPELAIRDQILSEFEHINDEKSTYFATIAKDIYDIILSMVPSLRRSYAAMDHSALIQSMSEFLDKYMCGGYCRNDDIIIYSFKLSVEKLRQDFPDKFESGKFYHSISMKMIDGKLFIYPWENNQLFVHRSYLGEQFIKNSGIATGTISTVTPEPFYGNTMLQLMMKATPRYILPCGLLVFRVTDDTNLDPPKIFLLDPSTPELRRSNIMDEPIIGSWLDSYVDDFGVFSNSINHGREILRFGPYGTMMLEYDL